MTKDAEERWEELREGIAAMQGVPDATMAHKVALERGEAAAEKGPREFGDKIREELAEKDGNPEESPVIDEDGRQKIAINPNHPGGRYSFDPVVDPTRPDETKVRMAVRQAFAGGEGLVQPSPETPLSDSPYHPDEARQRRMHADYMGGIASVPEEEPLTVDPTVSKEESDKAQKEFAAKAYGQGEDVPEEVAKDSEAISEAAQAKEEVRAGVNVGEEGQADLAKADAKLDEVREGVASVDEVEAKGDKKAEKGKKADK